MRFLVQAAGGYGLTPLGLPRWAFRGMKGCYVYFMDEETRKFFESRITR